MDHQRKLLESFDFVKVLDEFIINISAAGEGKSNTFYRIMDPAFENM